MKDFDNSYIRSLRKGKAKKMKGHIPNPLEEENMDDVRAKKLKRRLRKHD